MDWLVCLSNRAHCTHHATVARLHSNESPAVCARLRDPAVPRYMIVRHPHARLLSSYLGKVIRKPTPEFWPDGYNASSGFSGFVRAVTHADSLNSHFSLMSGRCGLPHGMHYRYLREEELIAWYRELVCALSLTATVSSGWSQFKSTHGPGERGAKQSCFVKTPDCRCKVDCDGPKCNRAPPASKWSAAAPDMASHGTFNNATSLMDTYFDHALATKVNAWARRDLQLFGYRPWLPGRPLIDPSAHAKAKVSVPEPNGGLLPSGAPCTPIRTGDTRTAGCADWCINRKCGWCKCKSCTVCAAAPPTPPAPQSAKQPPCHLSYVIFSMQRSGTTTLCRDLNRLSMDCMYELFNFGANNNGLRWGGILNVTVKQAADEPLEFINRVLRTQNTSGPPSWKDGHGTPNGSGRNANANFAPIVQTPAAGGPTRYKCKAGFKLFPRHAIAPEVAARLAATCIIYKRENVTAMYLSAKRAKMGCWSTRPDTQRSKCAAYPKPKIGDDFDEYRRNYTWWFGKVKESCEAAGRPIVYLSTESYLNDKSLLEMALA